MKKKVLFPLLAVVLALGLALPMAAAPVIADGTLPSLVWLPPLANQGEFQLKDGSTLPIKFTLTDPVTGGFVEDTGVKVDVNKVLFRDDFNDGNADGWAEVGTGGNWSVKDDESFGSKVYSQSDTSWTTIHTNDTYWRSYNGTGNWTNYIFESRVKIVSGGTLAPIAGIFFRVQGTNLSSGYYLFRIDARPGTGPALIKSPNTILAGGHLGYPQFANEPAVIGEIYTLKVVVNGTNIKCYVDGVKKIELHDSTYSSGGVGVGTFNAHVHFDDVTVVSLPATPSFSCGTGDDNVRISYDTVFLDTFSGENGTQPDNPWQVISGEWQASEGEYQQTDNLYIPGACAFAGNTAWQNYVMTAKVNVSDDGWGGVLLRANDVGDTYYELYLQRGGRLQLVKTVGGARTGVTNPSVGAFADQWWYVKAFVNGSTIKGKTWPTSGTEPTGWQLTCNQ